MVVTIKAVDKEECKLKVKGLLEDLNFKYKNLSIYVLAFIHKSIVNERPDFAPKDNERLEFLGDAVLELVVTNNLYRDFPDKPEGEMTDIRSALVRGKNLAIIGKKLNFQNYLYLGKGEEKGGGRENDYLLANVVESFIGALYIDNGLEVATDFINKHIYPTLDTIFENNLTKDFKTLIQEYAQAEFDITPSYSVISEDGPDHDKDFVVGIYLNNKEIGRGNGSSKKKAQESAAENSYKKLINK